MMLTGMLVPGVHPGNPGHPGHPGLPAHLPPMERVGELASLSPLASLGAPAVVPATSAPAAVAGAAKKRPLEEEELLHLVLSLHNIIFAALIFNNLIIMLGFILVYCLHDFASACTKFINDL